MDFIPKTFKEYYEAIIAQANIGPAEVAYIDNLIEEGRPFMTGIQRDLESPGSFSVVSMLQVNALHMVWMLKLIEREWDKEGFNEDATPRELLLISNIALTQPQCRHHQMSKERDAKFWKNVEKYEELIQLRRELHAEIDEVKRKLFQGLVEGARFDRNKRVQIVGSQSTTFSITKLREKFGDEWIEENGDPSSSSTIQVKYMRKNGPKSQQY